MFFESDCIIKIELTNIEIQEQTASFRQNFAFRSFKRYYFMKEKNKIVKLSVSSFCITLDTENWKCFPYN